MPQCSAQWPVMAMDPPPGDRLLAGIALRIGAACTYALMAALLKLASEQEPVAASEMLFYRALCGLPVVMAWALAGPGFAALGNGSAARAGVRKAGRLGVGGSTSTSPATCSG